MFSIASSPWGYKKAWKEGFSCARELSWQVMQRHQGETRQQQPVPCCQGLLPEEHTACFTSNTSTDPGTPGIKDHGEQGSESTSMAGILDMCFLSVTEHWQGSAGPGPISQWQPDLGPSPRDSPDGRGRWPKPGFSKLMPAVSPEVTPAS